MKNSIWLLFFLLVFVSCKREVIPADQVDLGKEYFPLIEGKFIEYDVDSLIYNNFTSDTEYVHLEFRDEVKSQFIDNEGRPSYVIERYSRYKSSDPWAGYLTYYATATNFRIEVIENNLKFIKLVLPVKANTSWKGNVYIPAATSGLDEIKWYHDWDYRYKNINEEFYNGVMTFPNSVVVSYNHLTNDSTSTTNYSDYVGYEESYSRNIGLIYRELTHWVYQPTDGFRNGFSVVMKAKNHN